MFTGIITDVGAVVSADAGRYVIESAYDPEGIDLGASIACDGCCLTVTELTPTTGGCRFGVDVSNETLSKTTLGDWKSGQRVNLERALTLKSELGGHMVSGHVDAVATVVERSDDGASVRFVVDCPGELAHLVAAKGSVALDGISLTVNEVDGNRFGINMVPHTLEKTNWNERQPGARVNMEVDLLARYVARISDVLQKS